MEIMREVAFPCGQRHDALMRLLMPYTRNISSVGGDDGCRGAARADDDGDAGVLAADVIRLHLCSGGSK